ncbi:MAG: DivIVA domain-containing protein, partial [Acidimicrobiia bacterium]|nr:DivIVA domain-containing protein [Acidimicrobiia bacterium]
MPASPISSSDDITFSTARRGYDKDEVESYLQKVKETIHNLEEAQKALGSTDMSGDPAQVEELTQDKDRLELENMSLRSEMDTLRTDLEDARVELARASASHEAALQEERSKSREAPPARAVAAPTDSDPGITTVLETKDRILDRARDRARRIEDEAREKARR